jgi:hypothetical protein
MPEHANDAVLDALIPNDVQVRRAIGSEQRKVNARLNKLEQAVIAMFLSNPPKTEAGIARFEKRVRKAVQAAYREQDKEFKSALRKIAQSEQEAVNGAVEQVLN